VTVADDRVGYDPRAAVTPPDGRSGGMGLPAMRARAAAEGTLRIESASGRGTRVTVTAPLA
jgi:signal transduction histidine kinase